MLEALPFIVCSNPHISSTLHAHRDSLHKLVSVQKPTTMQENQHFAGVLEDLVARHADDVPTMAKGCVVRLSLFDEHVAEPHRPDSKVREGLGEDNTFRI